MATRKPLVIGYNGIPEQIRPADDLEVNLTAVNTIALENDEGGAMAFLSPVYLSDNDKIIRAKADAIGTSKVIGIIYPAAIVGGTGLVAIDGILTATAGEWDTVCDESIASGLTFGTYYFLSPTNAGKITSTPPTTANHCVVLLGQAVSATRLKLSSPLIPILL